MNYIKTIILIISVGIFSSELLAKNQICRLCQAVESNDLEAAALIAEDKSTVEN